MSLGRGEQKTTSVPERPRQSSTVTGDELPTPLLPEVRYIVYVAGKSIHTIVPVEIGTCNGTWSSTFHSDCSARLSLRNGPRRRNHFGCQDSVPATADSPDGYEQNLLGQKP
eukprot:7705459-Pyramimonas_sp.AAC.1